MSPFIFSLFITQICGNTSELQDNEIAQEIQEELVRQEELKRLQEEKDAVRNTHGRISAHSRQQANFSYPCSRNDGAIPLESSPN